MHTAAAVVVLVVVILGQAPPQVHCQGTHTRRPPKEEEPCAKVLDLQEPGVLLLRGVHQRTAIQAQGGTLQPQHRAGLLRAAHPEGSGAGAGAGQRG